MIRADRSRCCGAGMCVLIDPNIFTQDQGGLVVIDQAEAHTADPALLQHAVGCCPGQALRIDDPVSKTCSATQRE
ncbi:ferredoxin [Nocardia callitridis]|uniref:ferredoxin n=1 Tax=Nocardia callitridis TaxID=648753 RepID=UPI003CD05E8E